MGRIQRCQNLPRCIWSRLRLFFVHLRRRVRMSGHNSRWKPEQQGLMWSDRGKLHFPDVFRLCVRNVLWSKASDDLKNTLNLRHEGQGLHQAGGSCRGCQSLPEDDTDQEFRGLWGSAVSWRLTFRLFYCIVFKRINTWTVLLLLLLLHYYNY